MQRQKEIRKTHFRWNVQEKVSLTFKVTFKHLRLEAGEGANSAKATGRAFQTEGRANPQVPGWQSGEQRPAGLEQGGEETGAGPAGQSSGAHMVFQGNEKTSEFLSKKMTQS